MSLCTTWTSSWFIVEYMRSLAGLVSNARDSGATSMISVPRGAAYASALP